MKILKKVERKKNYENFLISKYKSFFEKVDIRGDLDSDVYIMTQKEIKNFLYKNFLSLFKNDLILNDKKYIKKENYYIFTESFGVYKYFYYIDKDLLSKILKCKNFQKHSKFFTFLKKFINVCETTNKKYSKIFLIEIYKMIAKNEIKLLENILENKTLAFLYIDDDTKVIKFFSLCLIKSLDFFTLEF